MKCPVANPLCCRSRRRRAARVIRRHAFALRKVRLTHNEVKIQRAADLETRFVLQFMAGLLIAAATHLEATAS